MKKRKYVYLFVTLLCLSFLALSILKRSQYYFHVYFFTPNLIPEIYKNIIFTCISYGQALMHFFIFFLIFKIAKMEVRYRFNGMSHLDEFKLDSVFYLEKRTTNNRVILRGCGGNIHNIIFTIAEHGLQDDVRNGEFLILKNKNDLILISVDSLPNDIRTTTLRNSNVIANYFLTKKPT